MARQMKTPQQSGDKYQRRVQAAGPDYKSGVQGATDWQANTLAAAPRRNAGLQAAISDGRIDAGIQRAGDAKWKANTLSKGVQNWPTATAQARPAYEQGMAKAMAFQQAAAAATAGIDTTTREGRFQKMLAWVTTVSDEANRAKTGR